MVIRLARTHRQCRLSKQSLLHLLTAGPSHFSALSNGVSGEQSRLLLEILLARFTEHLKKMQPLMANCRQYMLLSGMRMCQLEMVHPCLSNKNLWSLCWRRPQADFA